MVELYEKTVIFPEGVQAQLDKRRLTMKGAKGETVRAFLHPDVSLTLKGNTFTVLAKEKTRKAKAVVGTYAVHAGNMALGVTEGYIYNLKAVFSHFPMTLKQEGTNILITNFLGEKAARKSKVVGNVDVKIQKDAITVEGINKEDVGQTASNLERATRVKKRDIRVFQDGVYLVSRS